MNKESLIRTAKSFGLMMLLGWSVICLSISFLPFFVSSTRYVLLEAALCSGAFILGSKIGRGVYPDQERIFGFMTGTVLGAITYGLVLKVLGWV